MTEMFEAIEKKYGVTRKKQRDDLHIVGVKREMAVSLISEMRNQHGFTHLVLLTAVDFIEQEKFQLTYILNNPDMKKDIILAVEIDRNMPEMESIHHLWAQAATYQRELFEMFGISFPGSPRLEEEFILEDWDGPPPYRRDFDTKEYSEKTFFERPGRETNDPAEYMKSKIYPEGWDRK